MIGSGVAAGYGGFSPGRGALALIVALSLQVGVNYSNDYSDGIRDTDAVGKRVGPMGLVGSGLAAPRHVMLAALACFAVAGTAGLALAALTSWWLVPVGVCCVLGAWCYTEDRAHTGTWVWARSRYSCSSASCGHGRRIRRDAARDVARPPGVRSGRAAVVRAAYDQQPARHQVRPPRRGSGRSRCG
jgi:hypothetical protein